MTQIVTIKIPDPLFQKLHGTASLRQTSRGELIRNALEKYLADDEGGLDLVGKLTDDLKNGKSRPPKTDWSKIYEKTRVPAELSPEDEVSQSRRRSL